MTSEPTTPTDALATALHRAAPIDLTAMDVAFGGGDPFRQAASDILAALPEGVALVTPDSLAAAPWAVGPKMPAALPTETSCTAYAAAIIQAAKEAERE